MNSALCDPSWDLKKTKEIIASSSTWSWQWGPICPYRHRNFLLKRFAIERFTKISPEDWAVTDLQRRWFILVMMNVSRGEKKWGMKHQLQTFHVHFSRSKSTEMQPAWKARSLKGGNSWLAAYFAGFLAHFLQTGYSLFRFRSQHCGLHWLSNQKLTFCRPWQFSVVYGGTWKHDCHREHYLRLVGREVGVRKLRQHSGALNHHLFTVLKPSRCHLNRRSPTPKNLETQRLFF